MKLALIFFSVLTSLSLSFGAQETPSVPCRGKPLSITLLPGSQTSAISMPLRFGGTRQFSGPPLNGFPSEKALRLVIKNREEFSDYWKRLTARASPGDLVPSFPEIDFSKEMVIVVAMGLRPSSGYGIIIDGTCEVDGQVEVFVMNIDATCVPAPAVGSAPADVVRLPRTDLPVVFRETQVGCKEWLDRVQKFQRVTR